MADWSSNAQAQRITSRWSPAPRFSRKGTARGRRLGIAPKGCAAVEDSTNGLRAARAAEMRVIAVPKIATTCRIPTTWCEPMP